MRTEAYNTAKLDTAFKTLLAQNNRKGGKKTKICYRKQVHTIFILTNFTL